MRKKVTILVALICIGAVSLFVYSKCMWILPVYEYMSDDLGFNDVEVEWKGRGYDVVIRSFEEYKMKGHPSARLHIVSTKEWSYPSLWFENFTHPRWSLPQFDMNSEQMEAILEETEDEQE